MEKKEVTKAERTSMKIGKAEALGTEKTEEKQKVTKRERFLAASTPCPVQDIEDVEKFLIDFQKSNYSNQRRGGILGGSNDYDCVCEMSQDELIDEDVLAEEVTVENCVETRRKLMNLNDFNQRAVKWLDYVREVSRDRYYEDYGTDKVEDIHSNDRRKDQEHCDFAQKCAVKLKVAHEIIRANWDESMKGRYYDDRSAFDRRLIEEERERRENSCGDDDDDDDDDFEYCW